MPARDPIDAYVSELRSELRVPRWRRRRIVLEVRAHLLDAAEAERAAGVDAGVAAERALARFGFASEHAAQFNRVPRTRSVLLRRTLVPWLAAGVLTSMATATVWAFRPATPATHREALHAAIQHSPRRSVHAAGHAATPGTSPTRRAGAP